MKVVLDTNCFIDAVNAESHAYGAMQKILKATHLGQLTLLVSRHSQHELEIKPDAALDLAKTLEVLPHFPVGTWGEQIGAWNQASGTWEDATRNEATQQDLKKLAKAGTGIRDRGGYVDALRAKVDAFVTSDLQLSGGEPADRIAKKYGLKVLTPEQMAAELSEK